MAGRSVDTMFRQLTPRQLTFDVTLAVVCVLFRLTIGIQELPLIPVVTLMAAALAVRRLSPTIALVIAWVGAILQLSLGLDPDVSNLAIPAVLYTTASYGSPRTRWAGLISAGAGALVASTYLVWGGLADVANCTGEGFSARCLSAGIAAYAAGYAGVFLLFLVGFVLSWTFGLLARTWRLARESKRAQELAEAERLSAQQVVVVEQERNRIARDMHDVVAHSLAVVIAQADGARYARESDPEAVNTALATISSIAREALGDVRLLLGQLRHNQSEGPQPVLADLERLIEQFGASGLAVRRTDSGEQQQLATGRQLAIYRIVQEALTNALRHGDGTRGAELHFSWADDGVDVTVVNSLADTLSTPSGLGHGLAGMRERAMLVGGRLTAEPRDDRFVVTVWVPGGEQ